MGEISAFFPGSRHRCGSAISQLRSAPNGITGRDQCSLKSNPVRSVLLSFALRDRLISEVSSIRSMRFSILNRDFGDFRNDTSRSAKSRNLQCPDLTVTPQYARVERGSDTGHKALCLVSAYANANTGSTMPSPAKPSRRGTMWTYGRPEAQTLDP